MTIEWHPLMPAALTGALAAGFYLFGKMPRVTSFLTAATLVFLAAGTGLLALAHHPVTSGPWQVLIILGAAAFLVLFFFIVLRGHHTHPLLKRRPGRAPAASGAPGAQGGGSSKGSHPKAPHHRAMSVTVLAVAFSFLLAFNWHSLWQAGTGGVSQTGSGITRQT
jgi:hypothetical protein